LDGQRQGGVFLAEFFGFGDSEVTHPLQCTKDRKGLNSRKQSTKRGELQHHVKEYVLKGSEVHTDALKSYNGLADEYTHNVIDHAQCHAKGHVHMNGLENFWSLSKRAIRGTYENPFRKS
jgi:hypothetical protein